MKKSIIYGLLLLAGVQFSACKEDEVLTPSGIEDDLFSVPADATGPEAELRREFYKETGIHLFFDENLRPYVTGKDSQGNDIVKNETIDFGWNLDSYSDIKYNAVYLTDIDEQRKAADLFRKHVVPHIKGSTMLPYSILLFGDLEVEGWSGFKPAYTMSCWRCLGVNVSGWINGQTDEDIEAHTAAVCKDLVGAKFDASSNYAKPFYEISNEYYREYILDYDGSWDGENKSIVNNYGFIVYSQSWSSFEYDRFPYSDVDFESFFNAVFDRTEDDFKAQYGEYPVIMEKYYLMRSLIEQTGYKF